MDTTKERTMLGVQPVTRDRFNRVAAMLGAIEERKLSQDEALTWLLDRYEMEITRRYQALPVKQHNGA